MTVDEFLSHLENVRGSAPLWTARCPAHEDRNASLSVREGDDGRTLVYCHTGCDRADILSALGLGMSDLFVERMEPVQRHHVTRPAPQPFLLTDEDVKRWADRLYANRGLLERLVELKGWSLGALGFLGIGYDGERLTLPVRTSGGHLCGLVRYAPGGSPKSLAVKGTPRELWPAPETLPAGPVLLVEGEPDAISAASLGVSACALPGAAMWREEWSQRLAGRRVVVMTDCDGPGRAAAARAASELSAVSWVRRVDLAPDRSDGFDLGDLLLAQREKGQLDAFTARLKALLAG